MTINVASKKIRKRKYVKRIVKDASQRELSHPGEPEAQSVLLTPDKSIHVNKPPDPFDLLLKSSPTLANSPILVKKSREKLNIKKNIKYNCSLVDCTGCENVNATKVNSLCHNTSDVKSHKLIVEVEDTSDPKYHDESISRIVKCMPVLNDINIDPHFKGIKDNHRLTATYRNSPAAGNSPLCSTPFQVKYRCKSIFNISPISKNINNSPKVVINTLNGSSSGDEDDNRSQCETSAKIQFSLVTHDTNGKRNEAASKAHTTVKQANLSLETEELHTFSTSEVEPCYGFAKTSVTDDNNTHIVHIPKCLKIHSNDIVSKKSIDQSLSECKNLKFEQFEDEVSTCVQDCLLSDSSLLEDKLNTIEKCTSKNSSCDSGNIECADRPETARQCNRINFNQYKSNSCLHNENNYLHKPNLVVALEKMDDAIFCKYYKKYKGTETTRHQFKVFKDLTNFEQKENFTELSNASYNTDCGDNLEEKENLIELSNNSYNKDCGNNMEEIENQIELSNNGNNLEEKENQIDLSNNGNNLEEKENLIELSNDSYNTDCGKNMEENENQIELSNTTCDNNFYSMDSFSSENTSQRFEQTFETNISPKEDAGISYVTTRRRHEVVNNSIIILPDNSFSSCDVKRDVSSMCGNTFELPENEKSYAASLEEYVERGIVSISNESAEDSIASKHEDILLRDEVPNRKGNMSDVESNGTRERDDTKLTDRDIVSGPKVPIVLQPGKKWERSLSIYKRMTSIVDINHSLLDYEQTESKGRKYRQSENCNSRASLCPTTAYEDLKGFLSDDCDDTIVDLSKLSIGDSVHEVTVVENFHEASRIATARDYVLRRCNQAEPLLFDECYPDTALKNCHKIGEGVYGEVFLWRARDGEARVLKVIPIAGDIKVNGEPQKGYHEIISEIVIAMALKNCHKIGEGVYGEVFLWRARDGEARVLKVIPIAGDIKVNGEPQKGYHEIISEIVIAMELSALRAPIPDIEKRLDEGKELDSLDLRSVENATDIFNEVLAVRCVHGSYPARLLELWELYDECHGSDNDNPGALPQHQHYLVLELRNAGRDLESYSFTGADQAYAVLLQLAFGLAVAEEALQFEHRDLHWGNVLVSPTDQEYATFLLRGRVHRVPRRGAACVVIDYSLSRVSLRGAALYSDLADDDSLFEAVGDRQFEVYRLMRDRLGNEWKNFEPYTNVLWLHYVADKMVTALRYERPNTKLHRHYLGRLRAARRHLLAHASAADFVLAHAAHADL
ncbi:Putative serine/threonine-protein kinase haspin-like [Papilio machaon]|uniref:non-specific serine/threonine protein kinase n=1 Tax=Papilio machaon TaxID=76193 RepID=A0A194RFX8_PAPMA|nr:Putative serine/threonine-protein kinase haspin-like [Papilio machaon]